MFSILSLIFSAQMNSVSYAGGVHCKECPAESNACMPLPNCAADQLPYSDILTCIQEGLPQVRFTLEENKPHAGEALVISQNGQSQTLRFAEESTRLTTHFGKVQRIHKNYFHPYYEYNLFAEVKLPSTIEPVKRPREFSGTFASEQNHLKTVSCTVINRTKR